MDREERTTRKKMLIRRSISGATRTYSLRAAAAVALGHFLVATAALLAERPADLLPAETRRSVNKTISNAVNGLVVFGTNSSVGSGNFNLNNADKRSNLTVMRVSGSHNFGCEADQRWCPFVSGILGSVRQSEPVRPFPSSGSPSDFSSLYNFTVGTGAGAEIRFGNGFHLTPAFELSYNRTANHYDYNNLYSQEVLTQYDKDIFNFRMESLSYLPSVKLRYEGTISHSKIIPSLSYSQLFVDSYWTNSSVYSVATSSGILQPKLLSEISIGDILATNDLFLAPHYALTSLYRDARHGFGFTTINEFGIGIFSEKKDILSIFSRLGLGATYYFAENFEGWKVGLETKF